MLFSTVTASVYIPATVKRGPFPLRIFTHLWFSVTSSGPRAHSSFFVTVTSGDPMTLTACPKSALSYPRLGCFPGWLAFLSSSCCSWICLRSPVISHLFSLWVSVTSFSTSFYLVAGTWVMPEGPWDVAALCFLYLEAQAEHPSVRGTCNVCLYYLRKIPPQYVRESKESTKEPSRKEVECVWRMFIARHERTVKPCIFMKQWGGFTKHSKCMSL